MRRLLKFLAWAILVAALVPIVSLLAFDLIIFRPHLAEVRAIVANSAPPEQDPPASVVRVLKAARVGVSAQAARLVMVEFETSQPKGGMLSWHVASAAWWACIATHLTEREQRAVFLALSPMGGQAKGFAAASRAMLGISLADASVEQAATLLVVAKSPSVYLGNAHLLARHSAALSKRAQGEL
jgi:hypothetical protein